MIEIRRGGLFRGEMRESLVVRQTEEQHEMHAIAHAEQLIDGFGVVVHGVLAAIERFGDFRLGFAFE